MDNTLFASAQSLYKAGDYARAYDAFSALLNASSPLGGGEDGHVLHLMGNCLTRQRRYQEASKAYQDALQDPQYAHRGSLNVNLGLSLNAQKRYSESLPYFQAAIDDSSYETAYKAYAAMGNAQLKLGNASDAGTSFRRAALENNNPDPARSLVNLGVCFMALGRPSDAVESYITALEFESAPVERNKTYANLGQAYVATGRMPEAVTAFESALQDGSYRLSDAAFVDLERARSSVEAEVSPDAGLDRFEDPYAAQQQDPTGQFAFDDQPAYSEYDMIPPADDTGFFSLSDDEIEQRGRNEERTQRKARNVGPKIFLVFAILLLVVVLAAGFLYFKGYGIPLQETVVSNMFQAYESNGDYQKYWANADTADISSAMRGVASTSDITVDAVQRSMTSSTAEVTATLSEGGEVHYEITLGRDGLGWKITDIQLVFESQQ